MTDTDWGALAQHLGPDGWQRQALTRGSAQEAEFVAAAAGLEPGASLLDVGCASGRHLPEWRRLGLRATGIDVAAGFRPPCVADALRLPVHGGAVDAAVALGGVAGYVPLPALIAEMARVARDVVVVSAFSLPFARRHLGIGGFTVVEDVEVRNATGGATTARHVHRCHDPAELPGVVFGVEPGHYGRHPPGSEWPELLAVWHPRGAPGAVTGSCGLSSPATD